MTNDELRASNRKLWEQWFRGHTAQTAREIYHPLGRKRVMFTEKLLRHYNWEGIDLVAENAGNADDRWEVDGAIDEVHEMLDPNLVWVDSHNECRYHNDDGSIGHYHNSYIHYYMCRDGKLYEWREYYNSCMRAEFDGVEMPKFEGMPPVELDQRNLAAAVAAGTVTVPGNYPKPMSDDLSEDELRARNEAAVRAFLATPCKDRMHFFAKDAVKKCMFTEHYRKVFRWEGWDLIAENMRRNSAEGNIQVTILKIHPGKDPNVFIVEAIGAGPTFTDDPIEHGLYANEYIYYFRFRNGLVCEWREYYNAFSRGVQAGVLPADHDGPGDPVARDRLALQARQNND